MCSVDASDESDFESTEGQTRFVIHERANLSNAALHMNTFLRLTDRSDTSTSGVNSFGRLMNSTNEVELPESPVEMVDQALQREDEKLGFRPRIFPNSDGKQQPAARLKPTEAPDALYRDNPYRENRQPPQSVHVSRVRCVTFVQTVKEDP